MATLSLAHHLTVTTTTLLSWDHSSVLLDIMWVAMSVSTEIAADCKSSMDVCSSVVNALHLGLFSFARWKIRIILWDYGHTRPSTLRSKPSIISGEWRLWVTALLEMWVRRERASNHGELILFSSKPLLLLSPLNTVLYYKYNHSLFTQPSKSQKHITSIKPAFITWHTNSIAMWTYLCPQSILHLHRNNKTTLILTTISMSDLHFIPLVASMRYAVMLDNGKGVQKFTD